LDSLSAFAHNERQARLIRPQAFTKENASFRIEFLRASVALAPFALHSLGFDALSRGQ
jgi:hypothetical protein